MTEAKLPSVQKRDRAAWYERNARLNEDLEPTRGLLVRDAAGYRGVLVRVERFEDDPDGGAIYVWQMDRTGYGIDNCEHYDLSNWKRLLRKVHDEDA